MSKCNIAREFQSLDQNSDPDPSVELTNTQQIACDKLKTVSAKIRWLSSERFAASQIGKFLGLRYQHVRNVLNTPLKRN